MRQHIKKCVMSSKLPWHQNVRHDVNKCNILQKVMLWSQEHVIASTNLLWRQKHVMTSTNLPWRQEVHQKHGMMTKGLSWRQTSTIIKKYIIMSMTSKTRFHNILLWSKEHTMTLKSSSWRQKVCHCIK